MQQEHPGAQEHTLTLQNRKGMTLTGVTDVPSFCEQTIVAQTACGDLTIIGEDLHISRLNLGEGLVSVEGSVNALEYTYAKPKTKGVLGKLWK
ncbi:MAG: sporulation protein YabP [Clostridia bacterium]|nr:sporulation protein YabP [Clostridia bacterium]